jgi:hypothetical protein
VTRATLIIRQGAIGVHTTRHRVGSIDDIAAGLKRDRERRAAIIRQGADAIWIAR